MSNPMMKKNPFLSMWLSGANSAAGSARGLWLAELHRQQTAMIREMNQQMVRFWTGAWMLPTARTNHTKTRTTTRNRRRR